MSRGPRRQTRGAPWYGDSVDECFARLLGETGCPMPLHQVKTLLLGALAGMGNLPIAKPSAVLWGETDPGFTNAGQARTLQNLFAGLRERLAVHRDGTPYRLSSIAPQRKMEDLVRYVRVRREELDGFHKGLDLAGAEPEAMAAKALKFLRHLDHAAVNLDRMEDLIERHRSMSERNLREMFKCMREWDELVEGCLAIIQGEQRTLRRVRRPALRVLPGGCRSNRGEPASSSF